MTDLYIPDLNSLAVR